MNTLGLMIGPVVALAGVWLGGWITSRSQERLRARDDRQRTRDAVRVACGGYLAAARQFDQYIKQPATTIKAIPHPTGAHAIPLFDERGQPYQDALESASADMLFVAVSADTVERAGELRVALMRFAEARATQPAGSIPDGPVLEILKAEAAFVHSARKDLELMDIGGIVRTMPHPRP